MLELIINALKRTWAAIVKNKAIFLILFAIQMVFFVGFFASQAYIQPKAMELSLQMADYLNNLNSIDTNSTMPSFLGNDPLMLYRNSQQITNLILMDILVCLGLLLLVANVMWLLSIMIGDVEIKSMPKAYLRFIGVGLMYLVPYIIIFYLCVKEIVIPSADSDAIINLVTAFLIVVTAVVAYFMIISFALAHNSFRNIFKRTFSIGTRRAHIVLVSYLISALLIGLSGFLLYLSLEMHIILFLILVALLIFAVVISRIFIAATINEIEKDMYNIE